MSAITPFIEVDNLTMQFDDRKALNNISFNVPQSSITGLLGPNGAGKSTTMRILSGCLLPSEGDARICGIDVVKSRREAQSCLGYLPEAASGFGNLTIAEFLRFCGEARGITEEGLTNRLYELCEQVSLTGEINTPLRKLSKGWRQRAWLAQSLLHDPAVLILDEPTDGLDPNQKENIRQLIRERATTKAVLISTHILEEAEWLCDHIIIMKQGEIVTNQPTTQLTDENHRLESFFSRVTQDNEPTMNSSAI